MAKIIIVTIWSVIYLIWVIVDTVNKYSHCTEVVAAEIEDIQSNSYKPLAKERRYKFEYLFTYHYDGKEYTYTVASKYSVYEPGDKYYLRIDPVCPWECFDTVKQVKKIILAIIFTLSSIALVIMMYVFKLI